MPLRISSPLLVLAPLASNVTLMSRRQFSINLLRYQSTFTIPENCHSNKKKKIKANLNGKRKDTKRSACTFQRAESNRITTMHELLFHNQQMKTRKKKYRYPSMPRVPATNNLRTTDLRTNMLYSGYRPIFINPVETSSSEYMTVESAHLHNLLNSQEMMGNNGATSTHTSVDSDGNTVYEFSMQLDESDSTSPKAYLWKQSATGMEQFDEGWDNIPSNTLHKLKPFMPPSQIFFSNEKNIHADATNLRDPHGFLQRVQEIINTHRHGRGRKRHMMPLLPLKKKFEEE